MPPYNGKSQESSVLSASTAGGNDPSLLSLRTDKSSYSVPDDGRAITIETNHQYRRQKAKQAQRDAREADQDAGSAVSAASQTSLLIEYFEGARGTGNSPSHRPSVRVKVTPSAQRRLDRQGTRDVEVRGNEGRTRRNPSYTQRISLSPRVTGEERVLTAHNERMRARKPPVGVGRTRSGEQNSHMALAAAAGVSAAAVAASRHRYHEEASDISSFSENSTSLVAPAPMNVEVIRESPRERTRRQNSGNTSRGLTQDDVILEEGQDPSLLGVQRRRSRSVSNDREMVLGEGTKLTRRRSKSMERERPNKEQREELREQRRLNKKLGLTDEKTTRGGRTREYRTRDGLLKSPRGKGESRSVSRERSKSRTRAMSNREEIRNVSGSSNLAENPELLTAVEDAIRRLILPQLEALKIGQRGQGSDHVVDHAATAAIAAEAARTFTKRASSPDFAKGSEGPLLVLEPDHDKGSGHGLILSGAKDSDTVNRSDSVRSRAPGFGMGPDPDFEDNTQYYTLPEGEFAKQAEPHERIRMPSIPKFTSTSTNAYLPDTTEQHTRDLGSGQYSSLEEATAKYNYQSPGDKPQYPDYHGTDDQTQYAVYQGAVDNSHHHVLRKEEGWVNPATHALDVNPDLHSRELKEETKEILAATPYPQHSIDGKSSKGALTPKASIAQPVTPLVLSRTGTPSFTRGGTPKLARGGTPVNRNLASPSAKSSITSLRRKYDKSTLSGQQAEGALLKSQQSGRPGSTRSMQTLSTRADYDTTQDNYDHQYADNTEVYHEQRKQDIRPFDEYSEYDNSEVTNNWTQEHSREIDPERMPSPDFVNNNPPPENKDGINWWFDPQLGSFQPRPVNEAREDQYDDRSTKRDSTTDSFEQRHLSRLAAGQGVREIGALASMRSTPVAAGSMQASVHNHQSNTSLRTASPQLGFSAAPVSGQSIPDFAHYQSEIGDEDDMLTNPYGGNRESRDLGTEILTNPYGGERDSRDLTDEDWQYGEPPHQNNHDSFGARALNHSHHDNADNLEHDNAIDRDLAITPMNEDAGYVSGANLLTPGMESVDGKDRDMDDYGAIDDMASESAIEDFVPFRGHMRSGSGNSHGMPSPLYDSAMGRGIDRIQSKDIVALMDHLTVRDAQRNARDTELLFTLVRSAAEMRDSFEVLKQQVAAHDQQMRIEVGQSTDVTIAKLSGPRLQPLPVTRQIKARGFDEEKEDTTKKTNLFRRALKGLGSKNKDELARIEEMLTILLDEVEGLKSTSYAYSMSNTDASHASHAGDQTHSPTTQQSHSQQSQQSQPALIREIREPSFHEVLQESQLRSLHNSQDDFNYDLTTVPEETASMADSTYYTNEGNHKTYSNANLDQHSFRSMTPTQNDRDGSRTPRGFADVQHDMGNFGTPQAQSSPVQPQTQSQFTHFPDSAALPQASSADNTPTKKGKRESFPKVSRWSESTQQSAISRFFGRKKKNSDDPDLSRANSEFEEDWMPHTSDNSPYSSGAPRFHSPSQENEKPSLEANRRSLEIAHPQPKTKYLHQLEAAAESQGHLQPPSPNLSQSTTSLNRFIQHGGSYNNIAGLTPMVPLNGPYGDVNADTEIEFTPSKQTHLSRGFSPTPPQTASTVDGSEYTAPGGLSPEKKRRRKKKHSSKDKDPNDPERIARRERRRQEKLIAASMGGGDYDPESVVSGYTNEEYRGDVPDSPEMMHGKGKQRASHMTTGTFGNPNREQEDDERAYIHV